MNDREFLAWLHERLEFVYKEAPTIDYMHKLRAIILSTHPDKRSTDFGSGNSSADMRELMVRKWTQSIYDLELCVRTVKCLNESGIENIEQLCKMRPTELKNIKILGAMSIKEIMAALDKRGLSLAP